MNYFDNIAAEEDIEEAVEKVEKILGKSGRMLPTGKNVAYNTMVSTPKHGTLWYGDLYMDKNKLEESLEHDKIMAVVKAIPATEQIHFNSGDSGHIWFPQDWKKTA